MVNTNVFHNVASISCFSYSICWVIYAFCFQLLPVNRWEVLEWKKMGIWMCSVQLSSHPKVHWWWRLGFQIPFWHWCFAMLGPWVISANNYVAVQNVDLASLAKTWVWEVETVILQEPTWFFLHQSQTWGQRVVKFLWDDFSFKWLPIPKIACIDCNGLVGALRRAWLYWPPSV